MAVFGIYVFQQEQRDVGKERRLLLLLLLLLRVSAGLTLILRVGDMLAVENRTRLRTRGE
jgi:hypothetical protein